MSTYSEYFNSFSKSPPICGITTPAMEQLPFKKALLLPHVPIPTVILLLLLSFQYLANNAVRNWFRPIGHQQTQYAADMLAVLSTEPISLWQLLCRYTQFL
jgi:hypothetical protein